MSTKTNQKVMKMATKVQQEIKLKNTSSNTVSKRKLMKLGKGSLVR
jgi:hypothetical protein